MCHNPYTLPTPQPQPQSAPVGYFDTESGLWWTELLLLLLPGMRRRRRRTQSQPDTPAQVTAAAAATTVRTTKGRRRRRLAPTFTRIRDLGLSQDCSSASSYTYTHSGFKTTLWRRRRRLARGGVGGETIVVVYPSTGNITVLKCRPVRGQRGPERKRGGKIPGGSCEIPGRGSRERPRKEIRLSVLCAQVEGGGGGKKARLDRDRCRDAKYTSLCVSNGVYDTTHVHYYVFWPIQ